MVRRPLFISTLMSVVFVMPAAAQRSAAPNTFPAIVSGPITAHGVVEISGKDNKPIALKPEEKIALMFVASINDLESDCHDHLHRICSMGELLKGVSNPGWRIGHLTQDPATDPSYTYTITTAGTKCEVHATPKRAGLGGFLYDDAGSVFAQHYYDLSGTATTRSVEFPDVVIGGALFKTDSKR